MAKTISTNQAGLILCLFTVALKLSALPSLLFYFCGNDSYVSCLIALVLDLLATLIVVIIVNKIPNVSFYELIRKTLGKIISKIVQIVLLIYLLIKCIITIQELHDYFTSTLFEKLNPVFYLLILGLILVYAGTKDIRCIGRVLQIIFWPTFIAICFTLIFPIKDIRIYKLLPVFEQGVPCIINCIFRTSIAFGDYIILFVLMGKLEPNKKFKKEIMLFMTMILVFIFLFFVIFVGCFGDFSPSQTLALAELPLHSTTPSALGKLEWLTVIIWTAVLLLNSSLIVCTCVDVFGNIFNVSDKKISSTVITAIVITITALTYLQLEKILTVITSVPFAIANLCVQISLLLILILAYFIYRKKQKKMTFTFAPRQKSKHKREPAKATHKGAKDVKNN